jgi:hypothetical protein
MRSRCLAGISRNARCPALVLGPNQGFIGWHGQVEISKILPHRRRPVPMAEIGPGLRREDEEDAPRIESSECIRAPASYNSQFCVRFLETHAPPRAYVCAAHRLDFLR